MMQAKQRAVYFTDDEWKEVKEAATNSGSRSTTHYVHVNLLKSARRDNNGKRRDG